MVRGGDPTTRLFSDLNRLDSQIGSAVLGRRERLGRLRLALLRFLRERRSESTLNQRLAGYGRSGRRIP